VEGRQLDPAPALEMRAPEMAGPRRETLTASDAHAYELAARLCAGLRAVDLGCGDGHGTLILARRAASAVGVDPDRHAIRAARARATEKGEVRFEVSGVVEFLSREGVEELDALVLLRPPAESERSAVLELLRARAHAGTRLVVGIEPDAQGEEALAALTAIEGARVLEQLPAEGSLIRARAAEVEPADIDALATAPEDDEPGEPQRLIACVNVDQAVVAEARLGVRTAPPYGERLRELERANWELRKANAALAHSRLGKRDSAAGALLARLQLAETKIESMERSLSWRLTAPLRLLTGAKRPLRALLGRLRDKLRALAR
jgi:SAM-dependent methyltransferase